MKLLLTLLLTIPLIWGLPLAALEAQSPASQQATSETWIEFHQQTLALKQSYETLKTKPTEEVIAEFNTRAGKVEQALLQLVTDKALITAEVEYSPTHLSKEQAQLLKYCFFSLSQIYGDSAAREMLGMGYQRRYSPNKNSEPSKLKTRLPASYSAMIKQILANDDLMNIRLPKPVDIRNTSNTQDLWSLYYKNLELANDAARSFKQKKNANPLKATEAVISLNIVLKKLVEQKELQTKTYPFRYGQLTPQQVDQLHKLVPVELKYGSLAVEGMLGIGDIQVLKEAILPAVKAGKLKMKLTHLDPHLTIFLPQPEFKKVSDFLDTLNIHSPAPPLK